MSVGAQICKLKARARLVSRLRIYYSSVFVLIQQRSGHSHSCTTSWAVPNGSELRALL